MNNKISNLRPMALWQSTLLFGIPSVYFIFIANKLIPFFNNNILLHPILSWIIGGYLVFIPLFVLAIVLYKLEGNTWDITCLVERFRLKKLSKSDLKVTIVSSIIILLLTGIIILVSKLLSAKYGIHNLSTTPSFMSFEPLVGYDRLYLLAWFPMFLFNIFGEELLWHGYILPRQELRHGKYAWIINSFFWLVFHLSFGVDLVIILLPTLFIIPYIVYRQKNTMVGVIAHAILNGPMFVFVSLGLIK